MSLQYKFIIVPVKGIHEPEAELNRFLRGVRVVNSHRHFVDHADNSLTKHLYTWNSKPSKIFYQNNWGWN
jgi:hypothetical protein